MILRIYKTIKILLFKSAALLLTLALTACTAGPDLEAFGFINISEIKQTDERMFSRMPSIITYEQDKLIRDSDFIFEGTYTRSENYTFLRRSAPPDDISDGEDIWHYTFFYFTVDKIYYGDESLLNTEAPVLVINWADNSEIILEQNSKYIVFSYTWDDAYYKEISPQYEFLRGVPMRYPVYSTLLSEYVFEVRYSMFREEDSTVLISERLLGYSVYTGEITGFLDAWLKEQTGMPIDKFDSEIIFPVLDMLKIQVETIESGWSIERIAMPAAMFDDFINKAIQFYKKI